MPSAYLLVSHGSRDPRPEIAMQQLAGLMRDKLRSSYNQAPLLGVAYLELSPEPLHEQIQKFGEQALAVGCDRINILPIFLLPGVHVMTDIPDEIAIAQQAFGQDIIIELKPYLGSNPNLQTLLAKQIAEKKTASWILLAHGSRRPNSLEPVEAMAKNLAAITAYWAVPPSLESRVKELIAVSKWEIAILPYFLFAGGITDAIAQSIETLKLQFPLVNFHMAQPLGASTELAELIGELIDR
ncbi:sirohydrochlorin chelatase [Calothrix sp. FACHB-156]|nr:sirohydrochlorin chelatase [Calothrix sp. FACHB-156]